MSMLKSILKEQQLRDVRLWQRSDLFPPEMLVTVHEKLAKSFSWHEGDGRRVAFLLGNEPAFVIALLATMRRGNSTILLNPTLAAAEISDVIKRTTPRLVVTSTQHLSKLRQLDDVGRQIDEIRFDPFGDILIFDSIPKDEFLPVRDDEFVCQVTSGVSGKARIVSRTYANIDAELENFSKFAGVSGGTPSCVRFRCSTPMDCSLVSCPHLRRERLRPGTEAITGRCTWPHAFS